VYENWFFKYATISREVYQNSLSKSENRIDEKERKEKRGKGKYTKKN
jgi:hypothetical protein